jgi:DNA repair photolyase
MVREILAKSLLSTVPGNDAVFGLKFNLNLYRGCEHQCIYCDSRSECYQIEDFGDVLVKVNAIELLEKELSRKRIKGTIGTGAMSDPYTPTELRYNLTGQALQVIAHYGFPLHLMTKSDLVLKDLETLVQINRKQARVCFTLTTTDDSLAKKIEPGAPLPSARLEAMTILASRGIIVGVAMMPILPFIEDNSENIRQIVEKTARSGAAFILPWFGMSLRDRQRAHYYQQLDRLFPGLRKKYEQRFGNQYGCQANGARELEKIFYPLCQQFGIANQVPLFRENRSEQLALL